jgi:uncharacterized protein YbaR (Trm112 family)
MARVLVTARNPKGLRMVVTELLQKLRCPLSRAPVVEIDGWLYSTDAATRRRYPIRDGIPIMLIDEGEQISEADFDRLVRPGVRT